MNIKTKVDPYRERWAKLQEQKVRWLQKGTTLEHEGEAYYGAIGGGYVYHYKLDLTGYVENGYTGDTYSIKLDSFDLGEYLQRFQEFQKEVGDFVDKNYVFIEVFTSLGTIFKVRHVEANKVQDFTDYEGW
jgi:hypothetical protein